jgi:serine/threonine protein kinase
VRVYDIEYLYRTIFIVMEYLSGQSIKDMFQGTPSLPFPRAMNFLIQVAEGLEYAHQESIVHQDIKPDNIFVRDNDRVKIVDFGLACPAGTGDDLGLAGTPYYMAPEQIEGDTVDERTDIYSLGITAFEMFTGQRPFPGPNVGDILKAHRECPVPDCCSVNSDLPKELNDFIQRATQKNPSERYQSMSDVAADLKPLAAKHLAIQAVEQSSSPEKMVLLMSYRDVDQLELTRLIEDFRDGLKQLGVDLSAASFPKR